MCSATRVTPHARTVRRASASAWGMTPSSRPSRAPQQSSPLRREVRILFLPCQHPKLRTRIRCLPSRQTTRRRCPRQQLRQRHRVTRTTTRRLIPPWTRPQATRTDRHHRASWTRRATDPIGRGHWTALARFPRPLRIPAPTARRRTPSRARPLPCWDGTMTCRVTRRSGSRLTICCR